MQIPLLMKDISQEDHLEEYLQGDQTVHESEDDPGEQMEIHWFCDVKWYRRYNHALQIFLLEIQQIMRCL